MSKRTKMKGLPAQREETSSGLRICLPQGVEHLMITGLIAVSCLALYGWTLGFPMVFDDDIYLQTNPLFTDPQGWTSFVNYRALVERAEQLRLNPDLAVNMGLRPLAYATFGLNYWLDGFRPNGFRAVNVAIHAGNGVLIYWLVGMLLRRSGADGGSSLSRSSQLFIPGAAALLFIVHPMATESVTYIVQRFTSLATLFYLASLCLHFHAFERETGKVRVALRVASVVAVVLGMLTKECTVTAPLMAVFLDRVVMGTRWRSAVTRALPLLACLPIVPLLVVLTAEALHGGGTGLKQLIYIANSKAEPMGQWAYFISEWPVMVGYLRRLIWPSGLNLDPDCPLYQSMLQGPVLAAGAILGLLLGGAAWLWSCRPADPRRTLIFAFTVWFFATLAVSSGLVPLPDLMAEHRAYLPSMGIFVVVACLADWARGAPLGRWPVRHGIWGGGAVVIVALAGTTCARNAVWSSPVRLWEDTVAKSPQKYRAWANLASSHAATGHPEEAVRCYRRTIELNPAFVRARLNLAMALNETKRHQEALETTQSLIDFNPDAANWGEVQQHLGVAYFGLGEFSQCVKALKRVTEESPSIVWPHLVLAMASRELKEHDQALQHFNQAAALQPLEPELAKLQAEEKAAAADNRATAQGR